MTTAIRVEINPLNTARTGSQSSSTSSSYEKRMLEKAGPKFSCLTRIFSTKNSNGQPNGPSSQHLSSQVTFACPKPVRAQAIRPITRFGTPPPAGGCFCRNYDEDDEEDEDEDADDKEQDHDHYDYEEEEEEGVFKL